METLTREQVAAAILEIEDPDERDAAAAYALEIYGPAPAAAKPLTFNFYDPSYYNQKYYELLTDQTEFLHLFGSAGSGKSRFAAQKEIALSFDEERRNRKTLIIRKVATTLKDSTYSELKTVIYEWGLEKYFKILKTPLAIVNLRTNVSFVFVGFDDPEKVKSITGVDRIWYEETTESTTMDELDQLRLRLRGFANVQITLSYNPINVTHWLNKEIHEKRPAGHKIFKTTYRDNEKLLAVDPNYAVFIESTQETNPNYYKVYGLGEWGQNVAGLIFPDYETVAEMPEPQAYGLDFGFNDPSALCEIAVVDVHERPKKSLYLRELLYKTHLTSGMLINELRSLELKPNIPIVADCSRNDIIEELRQAGFWVIESVKGAGSVKAGINTVKNHDIKIVAGSQNMFREISNYSWKNKNGEWLDEPQDGADHLMDGGRYACTYLVKPNSSGFEDIEDWV